MGKIPEEVKRFIVQQLACYDTPLQVVEAVKEEFGLTVSRQQCEGYDPTKHAGRALSTKWRVVFESTRAKFKEEVSAIPIAAQAYRLRQLQKLMQEAAKRKNAVLAAQILEQAAKEAGGMFTNRQRIEHTGRDGGPIQTETVDLSKLSDEALAELMKARPGKA